MRLSKNQLGWLKETRRRNANTAQRAFARNVSTGSYPLDVYTSGNASFQGDGISSFSEATLYGAVRRIDKQIAAETKGTYNTSGTRTGRKFTRAVSA